MRNQEIEKRIEEIKAIASNNEGEISYFALIDILKDNKQLDSLAYITNILEERGISVVKSDVDDDNDIISTDGGFTPADVNIVSRNMSVDTLIERINYNEIDMEPKFQRKKDLWDRQKQSQLIESLMLKIPLPTFYFDASEDERWVVIDGLQRLSAFKNFMGVEGNLKLVGLEYLTDFNGMSFNELPRRYVRRIKETQLPIYTVEKGTPDNVIFNIFKRINTGGLILTPQEIRHALYQGTGTDFICELADLDVFKEATCYSISSDRCLDCEFITRYIAFTELDYESLYKGNIDDYLIEAIKYLNKCNEERRERIRQNFIKTMKDCLEIFGNMAFRRKSGERRGRVNKALFEITCYVINQFSEERINILKSKKEKVMENYLNLLKSEDFQRYLKAGDKYSVKNRIGIYMKMLKEITDDQ